MDLETQPKDKNDSNVSCFALDGVVAEMVIDIDVEDSPQKSLKPAESLKLKEGTSVQPEPPGLFSESNKKVDGAMDSEKEKQSTSSKLTTDKSADSESLREKIIDLDENESLDSLTDLADSLKEDELKKSIFSDLNQIRRATELSGQSKDNMPAEEKKGGNKRKLAEIEEDSQNKDFKRKCTNVESSSRMKGSLKIHSQTSSDSERIDLKSWEALKPKMYNLFEKDSRLKNFLHLKTAMNEIDLKFTRQLYRVLFDKWAPNDVAQMKAEILEFSGFPFDRFSEEVLKRRHILKKLPDLALKEICYLLDLPRGKTGDMIFSILKFLHNPIKKVLCRIDPYKSCMQPFVKLDKLPFEYKSLEEKEEPSSDDSNQPNRRGRPAKKVLESKHLLEAAKKQSYNISQQFRKIGQPPKQTLLGNKYLSDAIKCSHIIRKKGRPTVKKDVQKSVLETTSTSTPLKKPVPDKATVSPNKKSPLSSTVLMQKKSSLSVASTSDTKDENISKKISKLKDAKSSVSSGNKSEVEAKKTPDNEKTKSKSLHKALKGRVKRKSTFLKSVQKKSMKRKIKKLKKEISELKVKVDETFMQAKGNAENGAILPSFGKGKENVDTQSNSSSSTHQDAANEDYSSEITLSADENEEPKKKEQMKKKKKKMMRYGKPLRTFSNIRDSINNGNFSALQRLHILLFGASDKPENLKANILAFGGFPFLEGSDEWKQKEFLLSLLSLSTLKEYSTLLCIDHEGDDQQTVINKLMKFLAAPGGSSTEIEIELIEDEPALEMKTKVVHSVLAQPIKLFEPTPILIVDAKSIASTSAKKKTVKNKEKKKGKGNGPRHRKVLMSEAEVRRLEADIKREQRIRDREKKLNDQLALKRSMELSTSTGQVTPTLQKNVIFSQASSLNAHRTPLGTSVFLPVSTTGAEISGSTSNYQAVAPSVQKAPTAAVKKASKAAPKVPLPSMVKQADAEQLNVLLQTVYKRRALKASGATISTPRTGESSKLGDLPNVKFLVVTANYSDLDVLHHLIYMTDAAKPKVRKNILDFSGFGFNEESQLYKDRMEFLNSLGYDISKRIAFLLGLCPYKTNIDKQDLNELIMYFLMSPCKTKQVPITHLPQTFFSKNMPEELCMLMQKHSELEISPVLDTSTTEDQGSWVLKSSPSLESSPVVASSTRSTGPKAKKSLPSASKNISLPPSVSGIPFKDAVSLQKQIPSKLKTNAIDTSTYALQKAILKTGSEPVTSPQEFLVQQLTPDGRQKTYKLIKLPGNHPLTSVIKPQLPISTPPLIQAPPVQLTVPSSVAQTLPIQIPTPGSIIQSSPVQIQTSTSIVQAPPVQIPAPTSIVQAPTVQVPTPSSFVQTTPISLSSTVTSSWNNPPGMAIPPGLIIFKDKNNPPLAITTSSVPNNCLSTVPIVFGQQNPIILPQNILTVPSQLKTNSNVLPPASPIPNVSSPANAKTKSVLPVNVLSTAQEESISSRKEDSKVVSGAASRTPIQVGKTDSKSVRPISGVTPTSSIQDSKTAVKPMRGREIFGTSKPFKDRPPTNDELFASIQNIILNADPEQITLRNVIDRVSEQYSGHNLKPRHVFMKDCVKKIILEST